MVVTSFGLFWVSLGVSWPGLFGLFGRLLVSLFGSLGFAFFPGHPYRVLAEKLERARTSRAGV